MGLISEMAGRQAGINIACTHVHIYLILKPKIVVYDQEDTNKEQ